MGLLDFLNSKKTSQPTPPKEEYPDFKTSLDEIEKEIFLTFKPLGFKKRGRTFNRKVENGIFR